MKNMLPSKPENYGALIKRSLRLYAAGFVKVIPFAILLAMVAFMPRLVAVYHGVKVLMVAPFALQNLWFVLVDILSILFFVAIVWHMHCVVINRHEPLMEDFRIGLKKVALVFIAAFIQSILFLGAIYLSLCVQFAIAQFPWLLNSSVGFFFVWLLFAAQFFLIVYVASLFIFLVPLIAIENKGIIPALQKSLLLVWNHWWRTVSVQATPWICFFLALIVIQYLLNINVTIYFIAQATTTLWTVLLQIVMFALFVPWVAALLIVQLKDLELRNKMIKR